MRRSGRVNFGIDRVFEHFYFPHMEEVWLEQEPRSLLIAMESWRIAEERLQRFARRLTEQGSVFFVCWGPGCKRMHDAADFERGRIGRELNVRIPLIVTSWHDTDTLEDTVEFWCQYGYPPVEWGVVRTWTSIAIGNEDWHETIQRVVRERQPAPHELGQLAEDES